MSYSSIFGILIINNHLATSQRCPAVRTKPEWKWLENIRPTFGGYNPKSIAAAFAPNLKVNDGSLQSNRLASRNSILSLSLQSNGQLTRISPSPAASWRCATRSGNEAEATISMKLTLPSRTARRTLGATFEWPPATCRDTGRSKPLSPHLSCCQVSFREILFPPASRAKRL